MLMRLTNSEIVDQEIVVVRPDEHVRPDEGTIISCSAGTLIINQSSITTIDPSPLTVPLVHSSSLSSFASNSATDQMRIEKDGVQFSDLNVDESLDGIVQFEGVASLRLKNVDFSNVKNGASDAVRIVVVGSRLSKMIEHSQNSGFPARGTGHDDLYKSLDLSEPVTSPYRSPTLLVYLSTYTAPTIHVKSIGRDVLGCGDSALSCFSLDEADRHLEVGFPSVISVHDSAQLASQLDINQDVTRIASGSGTLRSYHRSHWFEHPKLLDNIGCLVFHLRTYSRHLPMQLQSRTCCSTMDSALSAEVNWLIQILSTSGTLILTDCVIDGSSLIDAELTTPLFELKGGIANLASLTLQSITSSINLITPTSGSDFSLIISKSTFSALSRRVGSGVVFEGRMTSASTLSISKSKFTECRSLDEDHSGLANGGAVAVTLRNTASLEIRSTSFHSCSSGGNGGAVWIDASSSPASFTFSLLGLVFGRGSESNKCGASKRGSDVFILGGNLRTLVDATKWEGTLETAERGTLCGWDEEKGGVIDILSLFRNEGLMVSGSGDDDEGTGSADSPFRTVWKGLRAAEESGEEEMWVEIVDSAWIGKKVEIVGEEGRETTTTLSGSATDSKIVCSFDNTEQHEQLKPEEGMIVITRHSLNIVGIYIVLTPNPFPVFVVRSKAQLSLSECKVSGEQQTHSMLAVVHSDGVVRVLSLVCERMKMGGKGSIVLVRGGAMEMEDSTFSELETKEGAVVWGQTSERESKF
ncbi:hypothetical protein BLNAU_19526 [Blattamonas nauphoetae]|uniref:Uncharacterized protein n=1 Tax=Blattamonas nauphoetae TaxID=2049346 RepID=A0ABQ9X1A6_9EUKA|nr:hypothetical protein BLNAU_19526 [Blattamonas nauphoetae]